MSTTSEYEGLKYTKGSFHRVGDSLTVEAALQININGNPYTVTMQTPGNEKELIRGLLYAEDIYRDNGTDFEIEVVQKDDSGAISSVNLEFPEEALGKGYINSRSILSVSSCGICGKRELDDVCVNGERLIAKEVIGPELVSQMFEAVKKHQDTFHLSGGSHAAGAFTLDGKLLQVREDIGRHNAVDKVIGALLNKGELKRAKCLTVSGRISYEIVTKAFMAKIPVLAAVSAPSSLAVDFAKELGITLLAFCRGDKATCYAHPERFAKAPQ